MYTVNPAHKCELCPEPAYHQVWDQKEGIWHKYCNEHKDTPNVISHTVPTPRRSPRNKNRADTGK